LSIDSWFLKVPEKLKMKCFQELAGVKFYPNLNLKSTEQTHNDLEKVRKESRKTRSAKKRA
jgi:hypothetical protein